MPTRHLLEYGLSPDKIDSGLPWLTLTLKNVGDEPLSGLAVRLHSMDDCSIAVISEGEHVGSLGLGGRR